MIKKPALLIWFDKRVKTKEDFQLLMMVILIVFIVGTKCYLTFSGTASSSAPSKNHLPSFGPQVNSGYSFTK